MKGAWLYMSNIQMIQVLFALLMVFILLFFYLLYIGRKQIMARQEYSIYNIGRKRWSGSFYYKVYDFFVQMPITKGYFNKVQRQFEILMPDDTKQIGIKTAKTIMLSWLIDAAAIFFIFFRKPSLYNAILSITYLYFINNQIVYLALDKSDLKLLKQFDKFFRNVRRYYQEHGMIDEAIHETLEHAEHPIKLHISKIHKILTNEDIEEEAAKYKENIPNRFIKTFLALSVIIMKYGDKKVDNQSLFMTNLKYLRQEINIEIVNREKINFLFSGLVFIALMPILFLQAIQNWAISSFSGLKYFYYGAFGILTMVLIFIITIISYKTITHLKENLRIEVKSYVIIDYFTQVPIVKKHLENILNKNYGKTLRLQKLLNRAGESITPIQFLFKRILYSLITFLCCIILSFSIHKGKRNQLLTGTDNISYISSMLSERQARDMKEAVVIYTDRFKNQTVTLGEVEYSLLEEGVLKSKQLATLTAEEVFYRIRAYQVEHFKWYELLIGLLIAIITYYIPYFQLILLKKMRQMVMDDEVMQFQSIILMIMFIDQMSVETLLEWMENFANVFKKSIQSCINNLQSGELEALEELKKQEPFEPFVNIIEKLQICDKIGIEKAFNEIGIERINYQEKRKLENEIYTSNKTNYATIMAWMPFITTIGLYLIIPFMVEGFTQLITYLDQMNNT